MRLGGDALWRALTLGGVATLAGYWGPLYFFPTANQGPLLGIFLSGPLAFLLGLALSLTCSP